MRSATNSPAGTRIRSQQRAVPRTSIGIRAAVTGWIATQRALQLWPARSGNGVASNGGENATVPDPGASRASQSQPRFETVFHAHVRSYVSVTVAPPGRVRRAAMPSASTATASSRNTPRSIFV